MKTATKGNGLATQTAAFPTPNPLRKPVPEKTLMKKFSRLFVAFALLAGLFVTASAWGAQTQWVGGGVPPLNWSTAGNWSPPGTPGTGANVLFTNTDFAADNLTINNTVDALFANSINSLAYMNTNGFHNTSIATSLSVISSSATDVANITDEPTPSVFFVGNGQWSDDRNNIVYASISGGSLSVSNGNANLNVSVIASLAGNIDPTYHRATLNLTGLNSFTCTVSNVLVGHNFTIVDHAWRPTGSLLLGANNVITTKMISLSDAYQNAGNGSINVLTDGSGITLGGANTVNADLIRIGMHKCIGFINVEAAGTFTSHSATFRNTAGTGRAALWTLGDMYEPTNIGFFTSNQAGGLMDLTGAMVDALVDKIILGRSQVQWTLTNRAGDGNGILTFGAGTIDVNSIDMGIMVASPPTNTVGGSIGRGMLMLGNDSDTGPALLKVRSNIVMAVQLPGSLDVQTVTAFTNFDGTNPTGSYGKLSAKFSTSTIEVAGDILGGGGTALIELDGGKLDMKPSGDSTAGNVTINSLKIVNGGILANYDTLSLTNIITDGTFQVDPGQKLAPAGVGKINLMTCSGNLTLRGTTLMEINKTGATLTSDLISVTNTLDLGGTLKVSSSGDNLVAGDEFTLLATGTPPIANSFTTVQLPPPGSGLAWQNTLATDGKIKVIATSEPSTPPTITATHTTTAVTLSWPLTYTTFALYAQTNPITLGISGNWGAVPGVVNNSITLPLDAANGTVFFRLFQQ
jgi:hypothetical protein